MSIAISVRYNLTWEKQKGRRITSPVVLLVWPWADVDREWLRGPAILGMVKAAKLCLAQKKKKKSTHVSRSLLIRKRAIAGFETSTELLVDADAVLVRGQDSKTSLRQDLNEAG